MNTRSPKPTPTGAASSSAADDLPDVAVRELADERSTVAVPNSPTPTPDHSRVVGKYVILDEGRIGDMGIVYKACDPELDRIVALKITKGGSYATDEEVARFHREAKAAARLNHPNIIPVYESGQEHGCPYFTIAFAAGGSLAQQRGRFAAPRAAAALLETIARAIHHAHQRGILHRDLKPSNILFDEGGAPLVSDFGLAKFVDATQELTRTEAVLGTPSYMAPEQAGGQTDKVSPQTDVWALGVMLYELLTGQQPFKCSTHEEQLRKVRTTEPPRRYALADDRARWQRGEPVTARPPSWPVRAGRALRR